MTDLRVITNNVPRDIVEAWELTKAEQAEFDYYDWEKVEQGEESPQFFRYKGELHDLGEFTADIGIMRGSGLPPCLSRWDAYRSDTFFSALVVRYVDDFERVVVGLVLS